MLKKDYNLAREFIIRTLHAKYMSNQQDKHISGPTFNKECKYREGMRITILIIKQVRHDLRELSTWVGRPH